MPDVLWGGVPTHEDGQEGDAGGGDPGQDDHHDGGPHRDGGPVHQGPGNGVISATSTSINLQSLGSILISNVVLLPNI